ncbi:MAG: J domain-containing protein [Campylobacterales bacterium]
MQITVTPKLVTVTVAHDAPYLGLLRQYVKKYFPAALTLSSSVLLFAREGEQVYTKMLLQWIGEIYRREHTSVSATYLDLLRQSYKIPLKFVITGRSSVARVIPLWIRVSSEDSITIRLPLAEPNIINYFHTFFRAQAHYNPHKLEITLAIRTPEELLAAQGLVRRTMLLGSAVTWHYDKLKLHRLWESLQERFDEGKQRAFVIEDESFKVLNVDPDAPLETIRKNYLRLVKLYHPDRVFGQDEAIVKSYSRKFQQIRDAYETIVQLRSA